MCPPLCFWFGVFVSFFSSHRVLSFGEHVELFLLIKPVCYVWAIFLLQLHGRMWGPRCSFLPYTVNWEETSVGACRVAWERSWDALDQFNSWAQEALLVLEVERLCADILLFHHTSGRYTDKCKCSQSGAQVGFVHRITWLWYSTLQRVPLSSHLLEKPGKNDGLRSSST